MWYRPWGHCVAQVQRVQRVQKVVVSPLRGDEYICRLWRLYKMVPAGTHLANAVVLYNSLGWRPSNSPEGKAGPGQNPWASALAHGPSTLTRASGCQPSGIRFLTASGTVSYFPAFIRFTYTMSTDMSAGDTPEMREACPRERGRILSSFCRASMEMPSRWR